ncbi:MAG: hypothetical protein GX352_05195 [Clostridiales bacterium]|nr:hypothetical protein [Clostridiales bacterium]
MKINWLDFLIIILASSSVYHLIISEISVYFSSKSYLSKWILRLIISIITVSVFYFIPNAYTYLLVLSCAGAIELFKSLIKLQTETITNDSKGHEKIVDSIDKVKIGNYNNTSPITNSKESQRDNRKGVGNDIAEAKRNAPNAIKQNKPTISTTTKSKSPKIIRSNRTYELQEFLEESADQNILLSHTLQSNLEHSKSAGSYKKD